MNSILKVVSANLTIAGIFLWKIFLNACFQIACCPDNRKNYVHIQKLVKIQLFKIINEVKKIGKRIDITLTMT